LDRRGLLTSEGARADVDRRIDLGTAESRCHVEW
jgi:hypothetical protein